MFGHQLPDRADDFAQIEDAFVEIELAGFSLREVEDIVDDPQQMRATVVDVGGIAVVLLIADFPEDFAAHHIGKADDRVERGAQLVTHRGKKSGLRPARRLCPLLGGLPLGDPPIVIERHPQTDTAKQDEENHRDPDGLQA